MAKQANSRNTIRRVVRESFRLNQGNLANYDFVVLLARRIVQPDKKKLRDAIERSWEEINNH